MGPEGEFIATKKATILFNGILQKCSEVFRNVGLKIRPLKPKKLLPFLLFMPVLRFWVLQDPCDAVTMTILINLTVNELES